MKAITQSRSFVFFVAVFVFSSPAFFLPSFSYPALMIVLGLSILAALLSINAGHDFMANLPGLAIWTLGILFSTARALSNTVFASIYEALGTVIGLYALFVILHFIYPKLTILIYQEQTRPSTRLGKGCLAISLYILPTVGVIGAQIGRSLSRSTGQSLAVMGGIFFMIALASTHPVIAKYVQEREEGSRQAPVAARKRKPRERKAK